MPRHARRPAAYTRTKVLKAFLDQAYASAPPRIDAAYVEAKLGLKGGDVRAFLRSLEVLGLIDASGRPTERLIQASGPTRRRAALHAAVRDAYPELAERWEGGGGLPREAVEEHFRVEYGLARGSAAAAARLFLDLWAPGMAERRAPEAAEWASKGGEAGPAIAENGAQRPPPAGAASTPEEGREEAWQRRERATRMLTSLVQSMIERDWDKERIALVFDRFERLLDRLTG